MSKCIIAGSRHLPALNLNNQEDWKIPERHKAIYDIKEEIVKSGFDIDTVISGRCWGMDLLGE